MKLREKRYIWLPVLLLLYGLAMGITFGRDYIATGKTLQLALIMAADIAICIALFYFLRKKQRLAEKWRNRN